MAVKIIVDTDIIFSCLLNTNGTIGDIIFNSDGVLEFYSCNYMRFEIRKHWTKLKRISKLSDDELHEAHYRILSKINFVNEELIPAAEWLKANELVADVDIDDIDFVALTQYLKGYLWTGDKVLYAGLKKKKFRRIYNTSDLVNYRS